MSGLRDVDRDDMACADSDPQMFSPVTEHNRLIRHDAEHAAWRYCSGCACLPACHVEAVRIRADKIVMAGRYWSIRGGTQVSIPLLPEGMAA